MLAEIGFLATVLAYAVASVLFFRHLAQAGGSSSARADGSVRAGQAAPWVLGLAAVLHFGYVCLASVVANVCPVKSIHFFASVAALIATVGYLALRRRSNIDALGAFVAPVALTFVLGSRFVGVPDPEVGGWLLALHVTVNVLGDGLFLLASGAAAMYLIEERRLKQKRAASVFGKLPPLDALDRAEHRLLLLGFPLLTLGIISGTVWAHRIENGSFAEVARALLAFGTWILVAAALILRTFGWRGRRAAYFAIAGFICAVGVLVVYLVRGSAGSASVPAIGALLGGGFGGPT